MTRPRTPASAITTSLPRPRIRCGSPRVRANRTRARSSNALCAVAKRSAGPPTRIVVNRASGSSRDVLTPIRRWISVPMAIGIEDRGHAVAYRAARRSMASASGRASGGRPRPGPAPRRPRPRLAGPAIGPRRTSRTCAAGSSSSARPHRAARSASNASSSISRAAPASTRLARVGALVTGRVGVRHDDHRQAQRGHLGQRRRSRSADHQVRGRERGQHLVAQERVRAVARPERLGQRLAAAQGRSDSRPLPSRG